MQFGRSNIQQSQGNAFDWNCVTVRLSLKVGMVFCVLEMYLFALTYCMPNMGPYYIYDSLCPSIVIFQMLIFRNKILL